MRAVVMAGGEGTRLRPLTSNQPKPMVPIVGKPCMEHILELLREHGFTDVVITLAFLPQAIRSHFGDGSNWGLNIEYSVEETPLGTAGSVRLASGRLDETTLIISGDALCDIDLTAADGRRTARRARRSRSGSSRSRTRSSSGSSSPTRTAASSASSRSRRGARSSRDTINTGIYVLEPEVLRHVPKEGPYDFSKQLFPLLLEMGRPIYGHVCEGYWQDIGNLDQYRQANFDALDERVRLSIPGFKLRGNVWVGEGVEVDDVEGVEGPAFIGADCRIAPDAWVGPYSVLDSGVTLREHARVSRSVIDAGTYVGRNAIVEGAILRPQLRRPLERARPRGRRDRRPGDARRAVGDLPGRPHLPLQGGRDRRGAAREPDLGVADARRACSRATRSPGSSTST